jgi:spermidine dehydrogenase
MKESSIDERLATAGSPAEEIELGIHAEITRRDFLNAAALGSGAALLGGAAPAALRAAEAGGATRATAAAAATGAAAASGWHPWTGYAGVGDYSHSNGNTFDVMSAGHGIRDHLYEQSIAAATDTGETYDLVIAGGGYSGVVSAYTFLKRTGRSRQCLILENHPVMGGEAKRNEFMVRGHRLIGPQGSNEAVVPQDGEKVMAGIWNDVGLPRQFEFAQLGPDRSPMEFPRDNYMYLLWGDKSQNHGFFFDTPTPHWVTNPWGQELVNTPWDDGLKRDMLRWRHERLQTFAGDETALEKWLDTMTYDEFLTKYRKLRPEVGQYVDPIVAAGLGLGSDVISANAAYYFTYPGFQGLSKQEDLIQIKGEKLKSAEWIFSFPGGNDGTMRGLLKWLIPDMIEGRGQFPDFYLGKLRPEAMDLPTNPCRMRSGATVVAVTADPDHHKPATVIYAKNGKLYSLRAKFVIWAGASWSAKHAVQNLPQEYREAMESFTRAPMMIVNVALDNWRFLYKLGYTACSWRGGFGYTANLVSPMYVGDYRPRLDPDYPALLTFYVPFNRRGPSRVEQGAAARAELFATSYRDYELQIRRQMVKLFGDAGFDPGRDIAGIVLNRWGHAYVTAGPGFFFGKKGKPAPSDVLRQPLGQVMFAHSELSGHQNAEAAAAEGTRAAEQVLAKL